jgi:hypothetical protein
VAPLYRDCCFPNSAAPPHLVYSASLRPKKANEFQFCASKTNFSADVVQSHFKLRDWRTHNGAAPENKASFGDTLLFRISDDLQHRVTDWCAGSTRLLARNGSTRQARTILQKMLGRLTSAKPRGERNRGLKVMWRRAFALASYTRQAAGKCRQMRFTGMRIFLSHISENWTDHFDRRIDA